MLRAVEQAGVKVVVARASVVEHFPSLKGVKIPNNPDPDATFDNGVAGMHDPRSRTIVIATEIALRVGDTVSHEVAHVYDHARGRDSMSFEFGAARARDLDRLPDGLRGNTAKDHAETYAWSFSEYIEGRRGTWPNLYDYWDCQLARRCENAPRPLNTAVY
jgi:hypothetical protein